MNPSTPIAFIGGGNMTISLIGGLLANGHEANAIWVGEPDAAKGQALVERFQIRHVTENATAVAEAEAVVLAVKPQVLECVSRGIAPAIQAHKPLVISIAAGVREAQIDQWLGGGVALVRTMPNTPALVQSGATALHANAGVSQAQADLAESILRAVGIIQWVAEEFLLDTVTALSGSGPAYFFLVMEILEQRAVELGLPEETARLLTLQTALGAARMALESSEPVSLLRQQVTSPGGTTERAIGCLEAGGLRDLLAEAVSQAQQRSIELSETLEGGD